MNCKVTMKMVGNNVPNFNASKIVCTTFLSFSYDSENGNMSQNI